MLCYAEGGINFGGFESFPLCSNPIFLLQKATKFGSYSALLVSISVQFLLISCVCVTIKAIRHRFLPQSYPVYANHARYSMVYVIFCSCSKQFIKVILGRKLDS